MEISTWNPDDLSEKNKNIIEIASKNLTQRYESGEKIHLYDVYDELGLKHDAELIRRGLKPDFVWKTPTLQDLLNECELIERQINDLKARIIFVEKGFEKFKKKVEVKL